MLLSRKELTLVLSKRKYRIPPMPPTPSDNPQDDGDKHVPVASIIASETPQTGPTDTERKIGNIEKPRRSSLDDLKVIFWFLCPWV